jgi:predicted  nucleic acid-binding Zn-ribbon protein
MTRHLDTIVELQDTLTRLTAARARISGIPEWMQELHAEHAAEREAIEALEASAEQAAHERREAEASIADAQEKLQRYQQQINAVTTTREYGALLQEIDHVKAQIRTGEEQGLAALERQDDARRAAVEKRHAFRDLDERYATELRRWEAEKPAVASEIGALETRVAELRAQVPRPYLSLFERLLERMGGTALAPVRRLETAAKGVQVWHCAACHYRVRPQAVVEIRNRGSLVQCESCKRILYLEEEPA